MVKLIDPILTSRWNANPVLSRKQMAYVESEVRINAVPAGRRSYKTEGAKERIVERAITFDKYPDGQFFACAPTHQQAKDIWWDDLKAMVPDWALLGGKRSMRSISESELKIRLHQGAVIRVAGLDRPQRIEGGDWDGGAVDEIGDCNADVIDAHIRPMMMRGGWLDLIGVPEGRNHWYDLVSKILSGEVPNAAHHTWTTEEVLHLWLGKEAAALELAEARAKMDRRTYEQEYLARFVSFEERAYYAFETRVNCPKDGRVLYQPGLPLILCFDFNRKPGVACACQEQKVPDWLRAQAPRVPDNGTVTAVISEVYIEAGSNTERVCDELVAQWGGVHKGEVHLYGDPSGGTKNTTGDDSDWDIVSQKLEPMEGWSIWNLVAKAAPAVRSRMNAVNSRACAADGTVRTIVDPKCLRFIRDMEGCETDPKGELIKEKGGPLTHLSDGYGYYIAEKFPVSGGPVFTRRAA